MARMKIQGLEGFSTKLHALENNRTAVMSSAVYSGAAVMIGTVKDVIKNLPEESEYLPEGAKRQVVRPEEKTEMLEHVGISHFDFDGGRMSAAIGFNGYTSYKTKKYPNGVPVAMIARSIESGSSVRHKFAFMRKAGKESETKVKEAMIEAANKKIQELTK